MTSSIKYAPDAWNLLSGLFCIYKPSGYSIKNIRTKLILNLARDLNALEVRKPKQIVKISGEIGDILDLTVTKQESYADNILVLGPRYQQQDFKLSPASHPGHLTSGLTVFGIGRAARVAFNLKQCKLISTYEIEGKFGIATDDLTISGRVLEKNSFKHIQVYKLERTLSALQAEHQAIAFKYAGVSLDSQEAYDMASTGLVRPSGESQILIYGIRCIKFEPPDFTLEVQCTNENEDYLKELMYNIGCRLKCFAVTSKIRSIRFGPYSLESALVRKHWTLKNIIDNIEYCLPFVNDKLLNAQSPVLKAVET